MYEAVALLERCDSVSLQVNTVPLSDAVHFPVAPDAPVGRGTSCGTVKFAAKRICDAGVVADDVGDGAGAGDPELDICETCET